MGAGRQKILDSFERIMNNAWKIGQQPSFWDGKASEEIADNIKPKSCKR